MQRQYSRKAFLIGLIMLLVLLSGAVSVSAQTAAPTIISPEIAPDGTVTFRYFNDTATRVQVMGEWSKDATGAYFCNSPAWPTPDMVKDATGVWTYSVKLDPNYYNYRFYVWYEGATRAVNVPDPLNPPWDPTGINSQVFVPGPGVEWLGPQDVPHGKLQVVWYHSALAGVDRRMTVYTPPDYDKTKQTYPTLYLSHGGSGNDVDWSTQGDAYNILDNLIAAHTARPMVVVMTNFNGIPGGNSGFRQDLIESMIPAIEAQFRVNRNPMQRAYAGLSAGASRGSNIMFNSPEAFGFFGIWSGGGTVPPDSLYENPAFTGLRGIHVGCGLQNNPQYALVDNLTAHNMPVYTDFFDGCHTWFVWRETLRDFLTRVVFKVN
jgi:enterochelin esterase-like enzyme